jgi:hypothetical protein
MGKQRANKTLKEAEMKRHTISIQSFLDALSVFHWATVDDFALWFPGHLRRSRRVLKRLTDLGKVRAIKYGKRLIYALPRKSKAVKDEYSGSSKIYHGLCCTKSLVRFWRANTNGEIFAERFFYPGKCVPEWGIRYPNNTMLLFEFCTRDNFKRPSVMKGKFRAYDEFIPDFREEFKASIAVLFVVDISRSEVERYVGSLADARYNGDTFPEPFYFCDYETFLSVPIGEQLKAKIYFWSDGKEYSLNE